jgi:hypothetical protein
VRGWNLPRVTDFPGLPDRDEPNYKANPNGVSETEDYYNKIQREDAGAGTGPNSPNARQRYVPGPSLPHASSTFFFFLLARDVSLNF